MSEKRSRIEVGAEKPFLTKLYFSNDYKSIIVEKR